MTDSTEAFIVVNDEISAFALTGSVCRFVHEVCQQSNYNSECS